MLDTTKTAGKTAEAAQQETSEPGFDWLLIVTAAVFVAILGAIVWNVAQNDEATIGADSTVEFEDNSDATTGKTVTGFVTSQYFGYSGELFPEEGSNEPTSAQWTVPSQYRDYFGDTDKVFPPQPVTSFEDSPEHTTGKVASEGVTTPYFGFNPEFD